LPDRFDNAFKVRHHLFIGETKNLKAFFLEEGVAALIGLLLYFEIM